MPVRLTEAEFDQHVIDADGFCIECEEFSDGGCEPDAENYTCEHCDADEVMGVELALLCGYFLIVNPPSTQGGDT